MKKRAAAEEDVNGIKAEPDGNDDEEVDDEDAVGEIRDDHLKWDLFFANGVLAKSSKCRTPCITGKLKKVAKYANVLLRNRFL